MARISTYATDTDVNSSDRLLGTEYGSDLTKNYTVRSVGEHLRDRGIVTGGIQLVYSFQATLVDFTQGQFMISANGGSGGGMDQITSLHVNKNEVGGLDIEVLLRQMFTDNIAIYGADVKNTFGEYEAGAITENETSLIIALTPVAHNGSLVNGDRYYISKIPAAIASWGNITGTVTDQTDLVNYITSRLPDVPFENIQAVLDALNDLESIDLEAPVKIKSLSIIDNQNNTYSFPDYDSNANSGQGYILYTDATGNLNWKEFPLNLVGATFVADPGTL